jgi:hypothetical protein
MCKGKFGNHKTKCHCVGHYVVNDNEDVDFKSRQVMCCVICYDNSILIANTKNSRKEGLNII